MDRNTSKLGQKARVYGQARKSLWIETVTAFDIETSRIGQARKSLWIETNVVLKDSTYTLGQARKSLWIETFTFFPLY